MASSRYGRRLLRLARRRLRAVPLELVIACEELPRDLRQQLVRRDLGAEAAWVYAYVGNDYPTDPSAWSFQGAATKSKFHVVFADSVANGAQVWVCAMWINRRQESGPISTPVTTNVWGGGMAQQTTGVRLAA